MSGKKAAANFYDHGTDEVPGRWFRVGDAVPAEVVKRLTNAPDSGLFEGDDDAQEAQVAAPAQVPASEPAKAAGGVPPKGGPGSGKEHWADYARANNVDIEPGANRDDIIDALDEAGVPTE